MVSGFFLVSKVSLVFFDLTLPYLLWYLAAWTEVLHSCWQLIVEYQSSARYQKILLICSFHCWLEHIRTSKIVLAQTEYIFDTFEYFWVDHKSKFFCKCLATRWRNHHFCLKLKFWAEILLRKKLPLGYFESNICTRLGPKCPKTKLFLNSFSC